MSGFRLRRDGRRVPERPGSSRRLQWRTRCAIVILDGNRLQRLGTVPSPASSRGHDAAPVGMTGHGADRVLLGSHVADECPLYLEPRRARVFEATAERGAHADRWTCQRGESRLQAAHEFVVPRAFGR